MRIGIVGATGSFGRGLSYRWAKSHTIYVGSRFREKGVEAAKEYGLALQCRGIEANLVGMSNEEAMINADVIVLSVKFEHLVPIIQGFSGQCDDKIFISPIASVVRKGECFQNKPPSEGSVALLIQQMLKNCAVVSALHTIPANRLRNLEMILEGDVPICGDSREAKETVLGLVKEIENLNPIDAGPLEVSQIIEPLVPLILNIKQYGLKKNTTIKFI